FIPYHPSSCLSFFYGYRSHRDLHSFPTRRSSDLHIADFLGLRVRARQLLELDVLEAALRAFRFERQIALARVALGDAGDFLAVEDRKSTRLNSSHQIISYAVFCLKKKKI